MRMEAVFQLVVLPLNRIILDGEVELVPAMALPVLCSSPSNNESRGLSAQSVYYAQTI